MDFYEAARHLQHVTHGMNVNLETMDIANIAQTNVEVAIAVSLKAYILHLLSDEVCVKIGLSKLVLPKFFANFCAGNEEALRYASGSLTLFINFSSFKGCINAFCAIYKFPPPIFAEDYEHFVVQSYQVLKSGFN